MTTNDFSGKVVMVTGAAGNLGRAVVSAFAERGAQVALVDRELTAIQGVIDRLPDAGSGRYQGYTIDLTDEGATQAGVAQIVADFGRIDVLAHTVGGFAMGKPVHEAGLEILNRMFLLNAVALYITGAAVAAHMMEQGIHGRIIFVLAKAGLRGGRNQGAYTASKAAAFRIMESMALELKDHHIAVNGISPSIIDTPPNRADMPDADFSKWVTPEQLARGIVYLAGDDTGVYGTNLEVYNRV